eukprot:Seg2757.3 transcript_id=Seg2757.3/GoldUCD/mRNA.D3Y31 product="Protein F37C4.5" protein_id=Seg2757.3/GoldUCD/D3Y31
MSNEASMSVSPHDQDTSSLPTKTEVIGHSCPIEGVTVFLDRAEVKRTIEVVLDAGDNEVLVTRLPSVIDEDSIRVQCFGEAMIIEVSNRTQKIFVKDDSPNLEETHHEMHELKRKKMETLRYIAQTREKCKLLESEKSFLESYGNRIRPSEQVSDKLVEAFDKKSLESVTSFMDFYHGHGQRLNKELFATKEKIKEMEDEIKIIDDRLSELAPLRQTGETSYNDKQVSILLEAENQTEIKLILSYVVSNASWTPLYDLRAFTKDNTLQLLYFGTVQQLTGEDWDDAKLYLSTAMPSVGGSPPDLATLKIGLQSYKEYARNLNRRTYHSDIRPTRRALMGAATFSASDDYEPELYDDLGLHECGLFALSAPVEAPLPQAEASEGITSTTFEIARRSTIKTDNVGHKVSICQIDLKPKFEYTSVPKLVAHAFLKAKVTNDSNYALLAGPANVFLDNNFLTKSSMKAVSPLEEFDVSLGVDPAVKITYKPMKKFKQSTGILSKYQQLQFHQEIVIKNTKSTPVKITMNEQVPKSSEEKVKVSITEPVIPVLKKNEKPSANQPIKLNDKNNVEWTLEIPASETKEINLKYTVEHPANISLRGL